MRQHARPAALHAAFPSDHEALHRPGGHCPAQRAGSPGNREHMPLRTHDALGSPGARLKMDPPEDLIKAAQPVPRERRPCPARLVLHSSPQLSWAEETRPWMLVALEFPQEEWSPTGGLGLRARLVLRKPFFLKPWVSLWVI